MISSPQAPEAGLRGAVVGNTSLSSINGDEGKLIYRGLDIHDLARNSTFEEICYLLWFGALPSRTNLDAFRAKLAQRRALPKQLLTLLRDLPPTAVPMDVLRTAVSALGLFDENVNDTSRAASLDKAIALTAVFPTILAAYHHLSRGDELIEPRSDLDTAANFLYMFFGKEPDKAAARVLDVALVLHADHGMNASTFSSIVTAA
ncbi:MAG: citrate synthase, partial [Candidatus Eremiobacteraeota bacterium]|nr:citrate synthase [Candidatus Eremiobacteraeota bacterium]